MTSPISHTPGVPEKESLADIRRQVYVNFRQVLEREKIVSQSVIKSRMKKLVKKAESMQPLRKRLGHEKLIEILRGMVDEGLFESELRAWREFPELFPSKPPDESTEKSMEADPLGGCEEWQGEDSEDAFTDDDHDDFPPAGLKDVATKNGKAPLPARAVLEGDIATHTDESNRLETRKGIDRYLPYSAQHAILVPVQRILEETCFGFAQRYLPSALRATRYSCPAAVELTKWVKIFTKNHDSLGTVVPSLNSPSFHDLMVSIQRLRHAAVHRIPLPTPVVLRLVGSAADLAEMLQDHKRAGLIWDIYHNVESGHKKANDVSKALRENVNKELREIRRAREELDLREKKIMQNMHDEDAKYKQELGRRLERAVADVIAEWEGKAAANPDLKDDSVKPEEPDMKLAISEGEKGNESVGEKPVGDGFSWSVL